MENILKIALVVILLIAGVIICLLLYPFVYAILAVIAVIWIIVAIIRAAANKGNY